VTTRTTTAASGADLPTYTWPAELMTVRQVADTVLPRPKTVRQHIRGGRLRAVRFGQGSGYRIHRTDAQSWVEALVVGRDEREGVDRVVGRRRSGLAGAPKAARPPGPRVS
jgi:excisionase family DNA binding protein